MCPVWWHLQSQPPVRDRAGTTREAFVRIEFQIPRLVRTGGAGSALLDLSLQQNRATRQYPTLFGSFCLPGKATKDSTTLTSTAYELSGLLPLGLAY